MRIKQSCLIKHSQRTGKWEVHIGVTIAHQGTLPSCEDWARDNKMPVRNQDEINRVKFDNMPVHEMFCNDHFII